MNRAADNLNPLSPDSRASAVALTLNALLGGVDTWTAQLNTTDQDEEDSLWSDPADHLDARNSRWNLRSYLTPDTELRVTLHRKNGALHLQTGVPLSITHTSLNLLQAVMSSVDLHWNALLTHPELSRTYQALVRKLAPTSSAVTPVNLVRPLLLLAARARFPLSAEGVFRDTSDPEHTDAYRFVVVTDAMVTLYSSDQVIELRRSPDVQEMLIRLDQTSARRVPPQVWRRALIHPPGEMKTGAS